MSEIDRLEEDRSVAIDLSRRKEATRTSLLPARPGAPATMARDALARIERSSLARAGALLATCLALAAIFADLVASDLPIACRWHGSLYVMPNVARPAALEGLDCAAMDRGREPGDWILAPLVAHGATAAGDDSDVLLPPLTRGHPLGTDAIGRDVFARVVHGTRAALGIGALAAALLVAIGTALGALAGFAGGTFDALVARAVESLTAIPTLVLVLVVQALLPHPSTATLVWTIALTRWTDLARIVRAEVLSSLGRDHVAAARALGATPWRILRRHVMPSAIAPVLVATAFAVASVVGLEAAVDFLRVGSPDTMASWGETMSEARAHAGAWWLVAFPVGALVATLASLNLVGDALRDATDPRLR